MTSKKQYIEKQSLGSITPLKRQETLKEKIIFYCSNCHCQCYPLPKPLVDVKLTDKIEVYI